MAKAKLTREAAQEKRAELGRKLREGYTRVRNSDEFQAYLTAAAMFHEYSANNQMLIWMQRRNASKVAGFRTWQDLGRQVRKGEKGIAIQAPMSVKTGELDESGDDVRRLLFRTVHVFDVEQTEGDPLPVTGACAQLTGDDAGLFDALALLASRQRLSITRAMPAGTPESALGCYDGSEIWVKVDLSPAQSAKTLAHELGHHFAEHKSVGAVCREEKEIEAEATAYIVLGHFGIDAGSYSFGYLAHWTDDEKLVSAKLGKVQKLAARIIDDIEEAS